jgi:uncharacterized membrane protein
MSDIFCGIGAVPSGKKLGTAQQCVNKGQVRHWGITSITGKELTNKSKKKLSTITKEKNKLFAEIKGIERKYKLDKEAHLRLVEKLKDSALKKDQKKIEKSKKDLEKTKKKHTLRAKKHEALKKLEAELMAEES